MADPLTGGLIAGALIVGLIIGLLVGRRGRRLELDWQFRLSANADHSPPAEASAAPLARPPVDPDPG